MANLMPRLCSRMGQGVSRQSSLLPTLICPSLHHRNQSTRPAEERRLVTLIPGDGVSPELVSAVKHVFKSTSVPVDWDEVNVSDINYYGNSDEDVEKVRKSLEQTKVALKGTMTTPTSLDYLSGGYLGLTQKLSVSLDLYAKVMPAKLIPGVPSRHKNVDMVVVRESTEGEYTSLEHESVPGVVEMIKVITESKSRRIAKFAFELATNAGRRKVTCVHKANIMKLSDGLFFDTCKQVAKEYPNIQFEGMIVDNACMQLVSNPQQFDVLVLPNLYGSIVNNIASGLVGGVGVVPGSVFSSDYAIFESGARHTFAAATGTNTANPTAMILSSCNLLDHIGLPEKARQIREAVFRTIREGEVLTMDMGGSSPANQFVNRIIQNIK